MPAHFDSREFEELPHCSGGGIREGGSRVSRPLLSLPPPLALLLPSSSCGSPQDNWTGGGWAQKWVSERASLVCSADDNWLA